MQEINDTARRARTAGDDSDVRSGRAFVAASAGALFGKSHALAEEVHMAMVSRGYAGSMPVLQDLAATRAQWLAAMSVPAAAALVAATALGLHP